MSWQWVALAIGLVFCVEMLHMKRMRLRLPPGPLGLPFIGNVFDIPTKNLGQEFRKLSVKYGTLSRPRTKPASCSFIHG